MSDAARARRALREGADCRVGGSLGLDAKDGLCPGCTS